MDKKCQRKQIRAREVDLNTKPKVVVILSGGVDSTTLLYDVVSQGFTCHAITFNYGQKHKKEIKYAQDTCAKLGVNHLVVDLSILGQLAPSALTRQEVVIPKGSYEEEPMKLTVVPNRNMVLISLAVAYAIGIGASSVFYGAHGGDHSIYPDCRAEFVEALGHAITLCDWNVVKLEAPYLKFDKADILRRGLDLGVDYSMAWTCYEGKELACGTCGACAERLEAFAVNNVVDPILYKT